MMTTPCYYSNNVDIVKESPFKTLFGKLTPNPVSTLHCITHKLGLVLSQPIPLMHMNSLDLSRVMSKKNLMSCMHNQYTSI